MNNTQNEKVFVKQENILTSNIRKNSKISKKKWVKNIGMGISTPLEAINGKYIDKKCPFTGKISIRGRVIKGIVVSTKMNKTIIIRRDYLHYVSKYKRFEKRHKNIPCHCSPCFRVQEGDLVTVGQCRPLSKTIRFNVLRIDKRNIKRLRKIEL